jgi:hypothetical protein
MNTEIISTLNQEIITEPFIVEPEKIIEKVIEYMSVPPK